MGFLDGLYFAPDPLLALSRWTPSVVGQWYCSPLTIQTRALVPTTNELRLVPFYSGPTPITIDKLDVTTTIVGSSTSVTRMGIWTIDNQSQPFSWAAASQWATLLYDAGTVATDVGTGQKVITLGAAQTIPARTWFAIGGVGQVAAAATCTVAGQSGGMWFSPLGTPGTASYNASPGLALTQASVSGAFGATFTPGAILNADGGIGLHRSA